MSTAPLADAGDMRVLVATASKHGSTRAIGEVVAGRVREDGHDVLSKDVAEVGDAEILQAGAVILGSATYGARLLSAGTSFANKLAHEFTGPVWLFGVGLKSLTPDPLRPVMAAPAVAGYRAGRFPMFGGVVDSARLSSAERALIGVLGANGRDLRDLELVEAWAGLVSAQMTAAPAQGISSTLPVV